LIESNFVVVVYHVVGCTRSTLC